MGERVTSRLSVASCSENTITTPAILAIARKEQVENTRSILMIMVTPLRSVL